MPVMKTLSSPGHTGLNPAPCARSERRGTSLMVGGGLLLGTLGVFVEEAAQHPLTTVLFRCFFGALALLLWGHLNRRLPELALRGRTLLVAIAAGVLMVANWGLFFAAIPLTSVGIATVAFHVQPFWVMAMGIWLLGERISPRRALAVVAALIGLALATGLLDGAATGRADTDDYLLGLSLCLAGSLAYAAVTLIAKLAPAISSFALAWWQCAVGVLLTAWWPLWHGWPAAGPAWAWLAGLGFIHTGLAYALLYAGMARLPTSRIALLQFVYPTTAILVDWALYDNPLSPLQAAGVLLLCLALWTVRRER
ncbi:DMT family transporter [Zobellella aerophila]|uniref:DMT family transporter n=1 Tax=Zobellella aerophila TaxID=870480 RepID=A0ABP6W5T3_9GAMM